MEDMSVNRARGAADMTTAEIEAAEAANLTDAEMIEQSFNSASEATAEAFADAVPDATTFLGDVAQTASEAILPALLAYKGAKMAVEACNNDQDKLGYGALAAGAGAWLGTTTIGAAAAAVWGTWCLAKLATRQLSALLDHITPLSRGFFLVLIQGDKSMGESLKLAYAEYLQRMLNQSDDLVEVDIDSIPDGMQCSLNWLEWADFV